MLHLGGEVRLGGLENLENLGSGSPRRFRLGEAPRLVCTPTPRRMGVVLKPK